MSDFFDKTKDLYERKPTGEPVAVGPKKRPLGLTLIVIGAVVIGIASLLLSALFIVGGATSTYEDGAGILMQGIVTLDTPILLLLFAFGAWRLRGWALYIGLFTMAWEFLFGVLRLLNGGFVPLDAVFLVIEVVVFVYLLHPKTRSVFDSMEPARAE